MSAPTYRRADRCLLTELPDGTGVVLHLVSKHYFTLNKTAVHLWRALGDPARGEPAVPADALVQSLVARFAVDDAQARSDVTALLSLLTADGLVARGPG